ncbi:MAG: permease [Chloroflexota bacterium]
MLAGHFGLAAIVKSRQQQLPLWALMLSTSLLDVVFVALYFLGYESYSVVPGTGGGYGEKIFTADYSHSLVGALGISLLALIITWVVWGRRNALVIGAVVFSHWILDFVTHRGDLAVLPGNTNGLPRLGLGLWSIQPAAIALELVLCILGAYFYYHASMRNAVKLERQRGKTGSSTAAATVNFRQNAIVATLVMTVLFVATLAADILVP